MRVAAGRAGALPQIAGASRAIIESLAHAQGPDMRPIADMDRRLGEVASRLEQTVAASRNPAHFAELESRIADLDSRLAEAISRRDYPVLQGGILMLGAIVMAVNLLVDVAYGVINPRIRKA
mgnify:CR=1 FL=1